jgi:acyl-[acyl-carrier-protein] desaturase
VYDPRIHLEDVVMPILKKWRIFERDDFSGEGARMRDELGTLIEDLEQTCVKFEEAKVRKLDRDAKLAQKRAAKSVLAGAAP